MTWGSECYKMNTESFFNWLPRMQDNAYNLISFQTDAYTECAALHITPAPDSVLRIYMTWKALDEPVEIPRQDLASFERTGFTVVEWGGSEIAERKPPPVRAVVFVINWGFMQEYLSGTGSPDGNPPGRDP